MVETLIWAVAIFFVGGAFLLERRSLGQIAIVHPLVLCLITGYLTGQVETGLWLGISLQLLSVGQGHSVNWALVGIVASATLGYASKLGIIIEPGDPASLAIMAMTVLAGMGARLLERRQARLDGEALRCQPVWDNNDPARALERLIHLRLGRGFMAGGLQTVFASVATIALVVALQKLGASALLLTTIATLFVPTLGAAAAVGSLAGYRFLAYTGAGLLVTFASVLLL